MNNNQNHLPIWITSLVKKHPYFYSICSICLNPYWKEYPEDSWYSTWNKILSSRNAPFYIRSWTFAVKERSIEWEFRVRFTNAKDEMNVEHYKRIIELLPLWLYYFFQYPPYQHIYPEFPYWGSDTIITQGENGETFKCNRSLLSFLKTLFTYSKTVVTVRYQFYSQGGWGSKNVNSNYELQDYLNGKWGLLEKGLTVPLEVINREEPVKEWWKLPKVQEWIKETKKDNPDSAEWTILQRLQTEAPELEQSFKKAVILQKKHLRIASHTREQIFKGTTFFLK